MSQYRHAVALRFGEGSVDKVLRQYPLSRFENSPSAAMTQADSDQTVTCPSLKIARHISSVGSRDTAVFSYRYAHLQRPCDLAEYLRVVPLGLDTWASHGSEIPFIWNNTNIRWPLDGKPMACNFSTAENNLSATMQSFWATV